MSDLKFNHSVANRFLRYVRIDTQSDPDSATCPSTAKQRDLGKLLVDELQTMGISDAHLDEYCYVYATIPSNTTKQVPVICFCSHMDTSPDCTGKDVKPQVHRNYQGADIILSGDPNQVIRTADHPELLNQIGKDVVTTDGTTLLGADNKAGIAEIMDAAQYLMEHPEVKHGAIRILFTPDEEIGRGVDKVDMKKLGADYGYTIDGETLGHIEDETFSADSVIVEVFGYSTHPGFAKGKMQSAVKIASQIIGSLPRDRQSPETTEKREGFIHPVYMGGNIEKMSLKFIIRDFRTDGLKALEEQLKAIVIKVMRFYPKASYTYKVDEQYRNMKTVLDEHPLVVKYAIEAVGRAGIKANCSSIRGGTDGSRLSFMGLPCPNIFAGEHAFHSKQEWVSVQDMEKAAETIVYLSMIWEERAEGGGDSSH
jgi:tripeptide aminopeptidase